MDDTSEKPDPKDGSHGEAAQSARAKLLTIEELAAVARTAKANGKTVVLCHGVFDLVHLGHIRHLEAAKREGDILIVTITADAHVNKGPGRPIFPDHMRAEMLASVGVVDFAGISTKPSAESVLRAIQPDVYVKGSDYENPEDDLSGKITLEREAVEDHGGRLVFTKDITFSSSALINRYLDVYDPPLRDYLDNFRGQHSLDKLVSLIDGVKDYRVLLVGDTIIDEYIYVDSLGKSSKENMIATRFEGRELFAGGVIAAANHVADFCAEIEIATSLGSNDSYEDLIRDNLKPNVRLTPTFRDGIPTTRKCRFVDEGYMRKMFEIYYFDDSPPSREADVQFNDSIADRVGDFDVVIVTDFGHGLITPATIDLLTEKSRFLAVNAQDNAGNHGFNLITKYKRADYICIDGGEARLAAADKFSDLAVVAGETLPARIDCARLILTAGIHGCITYDGANGVHRIPAFTRTVVDTVGAGDAFLSVTAPLAAAGGDMEHVGFIGNAAGAMMVGIIGHRSSVEKVPLMNFINTLLK